LRKSQDQKITNDGDERPETATIGGEWEPQIPFEIFDRCPKIKRKQDQFVHKPTGGWIPLVMTKKYSGARTNEKEHAKKQVKTTNFRRGRTVCGSEPDCLQSEPRTVWSPTPDCPRPEERADAELKRAEANRAIAGERLRAGAYTAWLSGMDEMLDA